MKDEEYEELTKQDEEHDKLIDQSNDILVKHLVSLEKELNEKIGDNHKTYWSILVSSSNKGWYWEYDEE